MIFSTPPEAPYYTLTHSPWAAIKRLRCRKLGQIVAEKQAQSDQQSHSRQLGKVPFRFAHLPGRQVRAFHLHRLARLKRKAKDTDTEYDIRWQVATWQQHQKFGCAVSIQRFVG